MKKLQEISTEFENCAMEGLKTLLAEYRNDERAGVKKIVLRYKKKLNNYFNEIARLKAMSEYESYYFDKGYSLVAGIDEVGRGPLAGPVVACCVILPKGLLIEGVNDSKKLSEKRRNELFWEIEKKALDIGLGIVDEKAIDEINILNATKLAMQQAVSNLTAKPDILLIDALYLPDVKIEQKSIIKGDEKSVTIGAASIVGKVMRDEMMHKYAKTYPQYGFEKNKGYGSKEHTDAIGEFGLCPIHRRSFTKNHVRQ